MLLCIKTRPFTPGRRTPCSTSDETFEHHQRGREGSSMIWYYRIIAPAFVPSLRHYTSDNIYPFQSEKIRAMYMRNRAHSTTENRSPTFLEYNIQLGYDCCSTVRDRFCWRGGSFAIIPSLLLLNQHLEDNISSMRDRDSYMIQQKARKSLTSLSTMLYLTRVSRPVQSWRQGTLG